MIFEQEADTRISIHALVKRATIEGEEEETEIVISIHALVKRATFTPTNTLALPFDFNPRPREEGDVAHTGTVSDVGNFNPRPREEGDLPNTGLLCF